MFRFRPWRRASQSLRENRATRWMWVSANAAPLVENNRRARSRKIDPGSPPFASPLYPDSNIVVCRAISCSLVFSLTCPPVSRLCHKADAFFNSPRQSDAKSRLTNDAPSLLRIPIHPMSASAGGGQALALKRKVKKTQEEVWQEMAESGTTFSAVMTHSLASRRHVVPRRQYSFEC